MLYDVPDIRTSGLGHSVSAVVLAADSSPSEQEGALSSSGCGVSWEEAGRYPARRTWGLVGLQSAPSFPRGVCLEDRASPLRPSKPAGLDSLMAAILGIRVQRVVGSSSGDEAEWWKGGGRGAKQGSGARSAQGADLPPGALSSRDVTESLRKRLYLLRCSMSACPKNPTCSAFPLSLGWLRSLIARDCVKLTKPDAQADWQDIGGWEEE